GGEEGGGGGGGPGTTNTAPPQAPRASAGGPSAADNGDNGTISDGARSDGARSLQASGGRTADRPAQAFALQTKGVLAITNAKIFPISGAPIERGTIVIRDGIIADVGANVTVPAGAQAIDAHGGEVYPGFIDARTDL